MTITHHLGQIAGVALALLAFGAMADSTTILQKLRESAPHLTVTRVSPSPVVGIHEV